ncbi:MAG: kynureninase [Saprospiraceae bacterium]|nr:kynureninase [Saprospiraceae bacterium]
MSNILPTQRIEFDLDRNQTLPVSDQFYFPKDSLGDKTYLCGHSLGLINKNAEPYLRKQLNNWKNLAVEGHFKGDSPWIEYLAAMDTQMARIVGAKENEVGIMNSLTANIHFLFSGFYRPAGNKYKVIMEATAFSSDHYAVASHLEVRGVKPKEGIIFWHPNEATGLYEVADLRQLVSKHADELALIFVGGINYLNGQFLDISAITELAHQHDILAGFDLAHAAGNVLLDLHSWNVDFACWCTYKYLNGGPGSPGGIFIHQRHHGRQIYFKGWWGNSMENRFEMLNHFTPEKGVAGWQVSNPTILALPPLKASLEIFDQFGMNQLRNKSILLTSYLVEGLNNLNRENFVINTPVQAEMHGAMICLKLKSKSQDIFDKISTEGIITDFRSPDTIRLAPHPLYNSFEDCFRFLAAFEKALG